MVDVFPYVIVLGIIGLIALVVFSFRESINSAMIDAGGFFGSRISKADMNIETSEIMFIVLGLASGFWLFFALMRHPSLPVAILALPIAFILAIGAMIFFLNRKFKKRVGGFINQLELILRMISGAMRVGLSLRQAMVLVTEEMPNPARREFIRVLGRTNVGMSVTDSLEMLAKAIPVSELDMMVRAISIQQTTGGDLAGILDTLADTIKDRRRVQRKMKALTSQAQGGAYIIGSLPLAIGLFVIVTQPAMGHALLHTVPGNISLGIVFALEGMAAFVLSKIMQFDV